MRNDTVKKLRSLGRDIEFTRQFGRPSPESVSEKLERLIDILVEDAGLTARGYEDDKSIDEDEA